MNPRLRPLRVLQVVDGFNVYGAERIAFALAVSVAETGLTSAVASVTSPRDIRLGRHLCEGLSAANVRTTELAPRGLPRRLQLMASAMQLRRLLRTGAYDVIHVHTDLPEFVVALAGAASASGVRTLHNTQLWGGRVRLAARIEQRLDGFAVVAISEGAAEAWRRLRGAAGLPTAGTPSLIRNAALLDPRKLLTREIARRQLGIDRQARVIGFVGRLVEQKGVDVLLAAVSHVSWPRGVELHLFGDGPLRSLVEDARRTGAPLETHGAVADVSAFYAAFDGLLAPSRFEGATPLSVLDALVAGLPVAITACPGILEDPTSAGLLKIVDLTPEAICEAARELIHNGVKAEPSRDLSRQAMCGEYLTVYHQRTARPFRPTV